MKNIKLSVIVPILFCALSCGKNFNNLNVDPNNPQNVPPEVLITSCEKTLADFVLSSTYLPAPNGIYSQTWAQNNYTSISRYDIQPSNQNSWFNSLYAGVLKDLQNVAKTVHDNPGLEPTVDKNKIAIAIVLRSYTFQFLTDIFGPVPYTESLLGDKIRTPRYENQRDIYFGLLSELKDAISMMDESSSSFGSADIIYGGDMIKWKKFAHSLILRLSMRMSDSEPEIARTEVESAYKHAFSSVTENANFTYLGATPNNNPLHQQRVERKDSDLGLSDILIDKTLKPLNDPRLPIWADERVMGGGYFGRPFGQTDAEAASNPADLYSQPSGAAIIRENGNDFKAFDLLRPNAQSCLMGYAEVCFILAEAIEKGWSVSGSVQDWYNDGIRASMNEWGIIDETVVSTYLSQPNVNYFNAPGDWKQKIGVQKWLALFMQGIQGWCEWRRLDFKKLELPAGGAIGDVGEKVAPVRLVYPSDEQSLNSTNYIKALDLLGGPDKISTRVWWDVK